MLLISDDSHHNPGLINPCSICTRQISWGKRSVQCANCSLWLHFSCSGLSLAEIRKTSLGHSYICLKHPFPSQTFPSLSQTVSLSSSSKKSTLKNYSIIKNSSNFLKHSQLISTYPSSASSLPPHQLLLLQSALYHFPPSQNYLRILQ